MPDARDNFADGACARGGVVYRARRPHRAVFGLLWCGLAACMFASAAAMKTLRGSTIGAAGNVVESGAELATRDVLAEEAARESAHESPSASAGSAAGDGSEDAKVALVMGPPAPGNDGAANSAASGTPASPFVMIGPPAPPWLNEDGSGFLADPSVRWFCGRPVKPSRVVWMTVTGYSPDAASCGASADGLTATLHSVHTNAHRLAAADPLVLPYGAMLTVPGYAMVHEGEAREPGIVPVLDCGGLIKGYRLDVLFPTHQEAIAWGVQELPVTVWAYVDGLPAANPRQER